MRKRIIYIILGALALLALILFLWFWFFGGSSSTGQDGNLFGTGSTTQSGRGSGAGAGGNNQAPIGTNIGTGANAGAGAGTSGGGVNTQIPIGGSGPYVDPGPTTVIDNSITPPGDVIWNDGVGIGGSVSSNSWIVFNPTNINDVNDNTISGSPFLTTPTIGADGKPISLLGGLGVVIGGCLLNYGVSWLATKPGTTLRNFVGLSFTKVQVADSGVNTSEDASTITDCLVRTLGKIAVQQITDSTVNWINSGFNGKPTFVQDYDEFFRSTADQAAGEFLQSSNFAFLCSPFRLQVRIAIAQAYARRSAAPSCTLTQAVGNIENFMDGAFSEGGWGGLISFTTGPSNNPFSAYMDLQGNFNAAQQNAVANANKELSFGQGFLSIRSCGSVSANRAAGAPISPNQSECPIVTPGTAIVGSFNAATQSTLDSLQMGESIDQILAALQNALVSKIMKGGLANVNKRSNSANNAPSAAQTQAERLMSEMQTVVADTQQYATLEQRIISDIQTTQQSLTELQNCWVNASSSPTLTSTQLTTAQTGANAAATKIIELEALVSNHNANITRANASIIAVQEIQTDLLFASVAADVAAIQTRWNAMKTANNPRIYTKADVTLASQDRASVQANMATINADTTAKLQQCYAL